MGAAITIILLSVLRFADPMVGTDGTGHTFPGACYPFGMIQMSPDTRPRSGDWDGCSGYHYSDSLVYGFIHTHLSGTGCDVWCDILLRPGKDSPAKFSHSREKATPGFYKVILDEPSVKVRLTVGRRVAMQEYTFRGSPAVLTVDLEHRDYLESGIIQAEGNACYGERISSSWARKQKVCFYMEFSPAPESIEISEDGHKAELSFPSRKVTVRSAISSVSHENAKENLYSEYPSSFRKLRKSTSAAWKAYLSKLDCPYRDKERRRIFYTALYHTAIHPSLYSDSNGEYLGMDHEVHKAEGWDRYTVFSTWDTFRGLHPLLCEIQPERTVDFIKTMISIWKEAGKLPVWELSSYETNCMIGYNSVPIIADAIARGITGFDVEEAFEAMLASARCPDFGMDSFRRNGLVVADDEHESVSKTLEFAYDDWCVAQVARYLGREKEYKEFMRSSQYWRNVLDPETKFMRARLNGRWITPFDPREVNNNYTEANSWQYSFFVPHDALALVEALGGEEAFAQRLDSLFAAPEGTTGRRQADITGCIGQYAHGNEPSHHIVRLYDAIGRPESGEAVTRQIMECLYNSTPAGLCGNDDCGQMSAWYVLNALGRYPLCPGAALSEGTPAQPRIVTNPYFVMDSDRFRESLEVEIRGEGNIYYRIGKGKFEPYTGPFTVREACTMEAYSEARGERSFTTRSKVSKIATDRTITVLTPCHPQYTAGGPEALIDGARGAENWRTGGWQGYIGQGFEAVIDLKSVRQIKHVGAGFCQDVRSWIWMPSKIEVYASADGVSYKRLCSQPTPIPRDDYKVQVWDFSAAVSARARYVKIIASDPGAIPEWHPGAGNPAFIFIDEVAIDTL